jgi:hypothetical protein
LGGRTRRIVAGGQPGQKLARPHLTNKLGVEYMPVIPATEEVEIRELCFCLGKSMSLCLNKKRTKAKRLECGSRSRVLA